MTPDDLEPLSADLKALLDAEKPISAAPAGAKARMMSRLSSELFDAPGGDGGGSSQGGSGGSSSPAAPSGGAGASAGASGFVAKAMVTKLVVGASVASLAVGGAIGAGVHSVVATPKPVEQQAAPVVVKEPPKPVEPPPVAPVVEAPVEKVEPKPTLVAPPMPKLSADEQLALEKSYVEQARAAMARQDPTAALEALTQHEKRFPKGQLTEERMALQVMALVRAGRSIEANNVANEFRRRFPNGLMRSVVDGALAE
ncbi:MAG: hypothetical protein GQE15_17840 [Archangiaceae bacterium]|nr:hypothetical protein [Archangiaceae bacterium]